MPTMNALPDHTAPMSVWRWLLALALACAACCVQAREITDMVGRKVVVPDKITRALSAAPPIAVLQYALARDTMVGLNLPFQPADLPFIEARVAGLPVVGSAFSAGRMINPEAALNTKPDVILAWQNPTVDRAHIEEVFAKTGIPVVFIKLDDLRDWPAGLEFVGALLGREARAKLLADDLRGTLAKVDAALDPIPENKRVRVYYAEAPDGLATDCHTSFHAEVIELARGYNVYRCQQRDHMGMERISLEQVIAFDPQLILVQDPAFLPVVRSDARWKNISAVREGRIAAIPRAPFNWVDRPPSLMRSLGMQWLAGQLYPDRYPFHPRMEVRRFYKLYFDVDLSDADLARLLASNAAPQPEGNAHVHKH